MRKNDAESNLSYTSKILDRIKKSKSYPIQNKRAVENFCTRVLANGAKDRSVTLYLYSLEKVLKAIGKTRYDKLTREDVAKVVAKLRSDEAIGERTKAEVIGNMKMFYKYTIGEGEYYPKQVAWIRAPEPKRVILPEDVLNEDDIIKMLQACKNLRDRAIIASLYDTGARIGELLNVKLCDISWDTNPVRMKLDGKTGPRSVPIYLSVPYLKQYLNERPDLKANDIIWRTQGSFLVRNAPLDYDAVRFAICEIAKEAGIRKRVNPHAFRHARATFLAKNMTEQQLKKYMGWTAESEMAGIYVHLNMEDVDNSFLRASGAEIPENKREITRLKERSCYNCLFVNPVGALYCSKCGVGLNIDAAKKIERDTVLEDLKQRLEKMEELFLASERGEDIQQETKMSVKRPIGIPDEAWERYKEKIENLSYE